MTRAVFLDRDGVLNKALQRNGKPYPPDTLEELQILPGVGQALKQLAAAHFLRIVVTNQPDVARGTQSRAVVEAMHMTSDISTSTIFRYLKKLRHKGYIELVVDNLDNRVKYILATPLTDSYFTKMGKLMVKAME